uniref:Syntaxin-17 n=1 Tax=Oryzias sinensis TaxID=183150 RepID=A0A8C7XK78_9TELE
MDTLCKHFGRLEKANIREMEQLCGRVRAEDAAALDLLVRPVRDRASAAARDFLLLHSDSSPTLATRQPGCASSSCHSVNDEGDKAESGRQSQLHLPEIPADQNAAESWDNLEGDLKELSSLVTEFSLLVHSQQEKIDSIEDNINTASTNVEEGTKSLGKVCIFECVCVFLPMFDVLNYDLILFRFKNEAIFLFLLTIFEQNTQKSSFNNKST